VLPLPAAPLFAIMATETGSLALSDTTDNTSGNAAPAGDATDASATGNAGGYRVLARKYRPTTFEELIGQEALVRTLSNAFESGRIAQAWMLTGVRGIGKTTTARLIARALNYSLSDRPTVHMPEFGEHCADILASHHVDVLEMDAASHTSVDNIREIIEQVPYRPVSARYKVYIIDEVHMLSKSAFNALLKTLEEPPEHVKFIFATTEIRKVPITVLSRCQRFDLRRVPAERLMAHLAHVCAQEQVQAEEAALRAIARVAEGSVRDALSLLDQAIAYGNGQVAAENVREMLGLADHGRIIALFEQVMAGDVAAALASLEELFAIGAAPYQVLADLAAFTHLVTKLAILGEQGAHAAISEEERERGLALAKKLSVPVLSRAWQMLLKGLGEVNAAAQPQLAAEMVLVRLAHVAEVPPPEEIIRRLQEGEGAGAAASGEHGGGGQHTAPAGQPAGHGSMAQVSHTAAAPLAQPQAQPQTQPTPAMSVPENTPENAPKNLADVVALARQHRDLKLAEAVRRHVRPVSCEPGKLRIGLAEGAPAELPRTLAAKLQAWTGMAWVVLPEDGVSTPTLAEEERRQRDALLASAQESPAVKAVLQHFPQARILQVRPASAAAEMDAGDDDGEEA